MQPRNLSVCQEWTPERQAQILADTFEEAAARQFFGMPLDVRARLAHSLSSAALKSDAYRMKTLARIRAERPSFPTPPTPVWRMAFDVCRERRQRAELHVVREVAS